MADGDSPQGRPYAWPWARCTSTALRAALVEKTAARRFEQQRRHQVGGEGTVRRTQADRVAPGIRRPLQRMPMLGRDSRPWRSRTGSQACASLASSPWLRESDRSASTNQPRCSSPEDMSWSAEKSGARASRRQRSASQCSRCGEADASGARSRSAESRQATWSRSSHSLASSSARAMSSCKAARSPSASCTRVRRAASSSALRGHTISSSVHSCATAAQRFGIRRRRTERAQA